jgi:hypothetical protein
MRIAPELFDRLLNREEASRAVSQLDALWCARPSCSSQRERFGLSPTEYDVHLCLVYLGEVSNGGHGQFFLNPSGSHSNAVLVSLGRTGLSEIRSILVRACSVFPGGVVPQETTVRELIVETLPQSARDVWAELDRQIYGLHPDVALLAYLRANATDVLVPERY